MEHYVDRLYCAVTSDYFGRRASGKRGRWQTVLCVIGSIHSFKLLYLHYDLPVFGAVFWNYLA